MKNLIEQFILQIEEDQNFSLNTKSSYKSDLNELLEYVIGNNSEIKGVNQNWVKNYLKYLEENVKEKNSFNRKASTFRIFLRFLYRNKLIPANYSLIVNNRSTFYKTKELNLEVETINNILDESKLLLYQKLILFFIGKLGLTGTQIASLNTHQVSFENKIISLSDSEKIELPHKIFILLREYLLEERQKLPNANDKTNLFLNENGKPVLENDIYKLIKELSIKFSLQGKLTTRSLKRSLDKNDILSMQREVFSVVAPH